MHQKNRNRVYKFQSNKEEKTNKKWRRKNEEKKKLDAFQLWCWKRLLRAPWTARRSNQSILKEITPEYSLIGLRLKLQYFGHLMQRADSLEKTMMLRKIEGKRRRGQQSMNWLDDITLTQWTWVWANCGRWRTGNPDELQSMGTAVHVSTKSGTQLSDWTTTISERKSINLEFGQRDNQPHWLFILLLIDCYLDNMYLISGCLLKNDQKILGLWS